MDAIKKIIFYCWLLLLAACGNADKPSESNSPPDRVSINEFNTGQYPAADISFKEEAQATIQAANIELGLRSIGNTSVTNQVASPLQRSRALGMLLAGARTDTFTKTLSELAIADSNEITLEQGRDLVNAIAALTDKPYLSVSTTIWGQQGYPFATEYLTILDNAFNAEINSTDYEFFNSDTRVSLNNDLQLSSDWSNTEYTFNTIQASFEYLDDYELKYQVSVPMKEISGAIPYYSNNRYEAFELAVFDKAIKLLVIMPYHSDFNSTLSQLSITELASIQQNLVPSNRTVYLPFLSLYDSDSIDYLPGTSDDFSGINLEGQFYLSHFSYSAEFSISNTGILGEAAGNSTIKEIPTNLDSDTSGGVVVSIPPTTKPCYDPEQARPFIFIVRDMDDNSTLFIGRLDLPDNGVPVTPVSYVSIFSACP